MDVKSNHRIYKRAMPAAEFVREQGFADTLSRIDSDTTWLAGHTRWPTRGSVEQISNTHPIRSGAVIGTHNGTIFNADELFARFNLPRFAEVDSEIISRMTDADLDNGRIDIAKLKKRLMLCKGQISAVMASKLDPRTIIIIKGNMPLELRYHPEHHVIVYAYDPWYLDVALSREMGWQVIEAKPMTIISLNTDNLPHFESAPFRLEKRHS